MSLHKIKHFKLTVFNYFYASSSFTQAASKKNQNTMATLSVSKQTIDRKRKNYRFIVYKQRNLISTVIKVYNFDKLNPVPKLISILLSEMMWGKNLDFKGTYRDHRVTGTLNFHKILDFCILVMVLDV